MPSGDSVLYASSVRIGVELQPVAVDARVLNVSESGVSLVNSRALMGGLRLEGT